MNIKWKPIIINGQETNYIISEYSNIMNKNTGKMLVASKLQGSERERVHLYINGHGKDYKIYRLAYESFYGPIPPNMTLDHIDENIHNNHISNFRLLSASENVKSYLINHPEHGFQKKYSDQDLRKFFDSMKQGIYYKESAKLINLPESYAYSLLKGLRRRDLWSEYQPFPESAHRKSYLSPSDKEIAIACIIDGFSTREILNYINVSYDTKGIDAISKLRQKIGIKDPKYFEESFINDIDTLILNGKSNKEIYEIMSMEITQKNSDMMARRRKKLGIPNNNYTIGNYEETQLIKKYILDGFSNSEILKLIHKEKSMYYVNLFGKLRKSIKKKAD